MLKGLVKFPFRVARGAIRRFTGRRGAEEVRLPARTEPPPAVTPAPAPAAAAAPKPAPAPVPAPAAAPEPAPAAAPEPTEVAPAKKGGRAKAGETKPAKRGKKASAEPAPAAPGVRVAGEPTPNPNAMKFTCSVKVVPKGSLSYNNAAVAHAHPLGAALFALGGVKAVFAVNDFVTVTKEDDANWAVLVPQVEEAIVTVLADRAQA